MDFGRFIMLESTRNLIHMGSVHSFLMLGSAIDKHKGMTNTDFSCMGFFHFCVAYVHGGGTADQHRPRDQGRPTGSSVGGSR